MKNLYEYPQRIRELETELKRENFQLDNKWNVIDEENIQLKKKLEQADKSYDILANENEMLLLRADRLEAERNELKERMEEMKYDFDFINSDRNLLKAENEKWRIDFEANAEAYDIQGKQLLEALDEIEKLKEKNVDLGFESVRAFERGQKFPCSLNCDECTEKCRAWQNGYNATCERECDNCEVLADMQSLKNVLSKLMFDYADDLRGDTE